MRVLHIFSALGLAAVASGIFATESCAAGASEKLVSNPDLQAILDSGKAARVVVTVAMSGAQKLQADLSSPATREAAKTAVRAAVEPVIARHFSAPGAPRTASLTTSPRFVVELTEAQIKELAEDPAVVSIQYDIPMHKHLVTSLPLIEMDDVYAAGGRGANTTVAIIDDGAQRNHPFLRFRYISAAEACIRLLSGDCPNGQDTQFGSGAGAAAAGASHGTHVAGIAVGRNTLTGDPRKGVAPSARFVPINVFRGADSTSFSNLDRAFEHVEDLAQTSSNVHKIRSVNMSIGGGGNTGDCDAQNPNTKAILDRLRSLGIAVAISAGNGSGRDSMGAPACVTTAVSVSATSHTGVASSYTDINRTTDLFAPGGDFPTQGDSCILSSVPTSTYDRFCGTSMASPHVAGAIAVLRGLFPTQSVNRILAVLAGTGKLTADTRSGGIHAKPLIQVDDARRLLISKAKPTNDSFSAPSALTLDQRRGFRNVFATKQTGEPNHGVTTSTHSIWFTFRPSASRRFEINLQDSTFDTVLAVYRGSSLGGLTLVARNDDQVVGDPTSRVTFNGVAGTTYRIAVAGKRSGQEGMAIVKVGVPPSPPSNDNFASATAVTVSTSTVTRTGNNNLATFQTGEPRAFGSGTKSVWWRFQAPASGLYTIDTNGSAFDTTLGIYTGTSVSALTQVAVDDDSGEGLASLVTFSGVSGRTYRIQVNSFGAIGGAITLHIDPPGVGGVAAVAETATTK